MTTMDEILMYRMKTLTTDRIPRRWCVVHFDGDGLDWQMLTYERRWSVGHGASGFGGESFVQMFQGLGGSGRVYLVGWDIYAALCWQGLYGQIDRGDVVIKTREVERIEADGKKVIRKLSGMVCCGNPTILDLEICGTSVTCFDFINLGYDRQETIGDAVKLLKDHIRMIEELQMGGFAVTAAGQGRNRFLRYDLGEQRVYVHQVREVRKLERAAYIGGRCEVLRLGRQDCECWHLDVKSMYAYLASKKRFPVKLLASGTAMSLHEASVGSYGYNHLIARVEIVTDDPIYPLRVDNKTIYPTGRFITTLCNPEIRYALAHGHVINIRDWASYATEVIFSENSEWFFEARKRLKDIGLDHLKEGFKKSQNSMYGNLGKHSRMWIDCERVGDERWGQWFRRHPVTNQVCEGRAINDVHQYLDLDGEPETAVPAISATMCSYGRMMLWRLICQAGRENVFYYDTDGLIVNELGKDNLAKYRCEQCPCPGMLDTREKSGDVDLRGIKFYRFGDRWSQAGVPHNAKRNPDGSVVFNEHEDFAYSLWHKAPFYHAYVERKRRANQFYRHGIVLPGGHVVPFTVDIVIDNETGEERNVIG